MNTDELDELVAEVATKGMIGMQLAMADGSPKHHKKVLKEARELIELYCHKQVIEELEIILNGGFDGTYAGYGKATEGYVTNRIAELRETL